MMRYPEQNAGGPLAEWITRLITPEDADRKVLGWIRQAYAVA
jgi:hypothetical protein